MFFEAFFVYVLDSTALISKNIITLTVEVSKIFINSLMEKNAEKTPIAFSKSSGLKVQKLFKLNYLQ